MRLLDSWTQGLLDEDLSILKPGLFGGRRLSPASRHDAPELGPREVRVLVSGGGGAR